MRSTRLGRPDTASDAMLAAELELDKPRSFTMVAGAGAGKTTSLVKALARTLDVHSSKLRARGQQIACITFTVVAADEIRADVEDNELVHVSTIHSFLWTIIKPFETDIGAWVVEHLETKLAELATARDAFTSRTKTTTKEKNERDTARRHEQLAAARTITSWGYATGADYARGVIGHEDVLKMATQSVMTRPLLAKIVASRFPFIFVDESQDTMPDVVNCLKHVRDKAAGAVSVGFFGDPMQSIFPRGIKSIEVDDTWLSLTKPENYRSSARVLAVVNNIREAGGGDLQEPGTRDTQDVGHADVFVLPADEHRTANLEAVRVWLDLRDGSGMWTDNDPAVGAKLLVMMHKMAAERLGFGELFEAFHQKGAPPDLGDSFEAGSAWPLAPMLRVVMPAVAAHDDGRSLIPLLRTRSPALSNAALGTSDPRSALRKAASAVAELSEVVHAGGPGSLGRALTIAGRTGLAELDPRLSSYLKTDGSPGAAVLSDKEVALLDAVKECDTNQLPAYVRYVDGLSPFATHHGTKGAEYERVLVIIDHEVTKKFPAMSYGKLLGQEGLTDVDTAHQQAGEETAVDRTRRLLYVCCSRAIQGLAVVVFAADVASASEALVDSGLFGSQVRTLADLTPKQPT